MANGKALATTTTGDLLPAVPAMQGRGQQMMSQAEVGSSALAMRSRAEMEARVFMAMAHPRSWDDTRVKLLADCQRPAFAEKAWFRKPVGEGVVGLSIRFAEAFMRHAGNMRQTSDIIHDDGDKRIIRVSVTDLESNTEFERSVTVSKTLERSRADGRPILGQRKNSKGYDVYIVKATSDDDIADKEAAAISKAVRQCILRFIPGDLKEECTNAILDTREKEVKEDPDKHRKAVLDAFAKMKIMPKEVAEYLGCDVAQATPAQLVELRGVWQSINEGEGTWAEALRTRKAETSGDEAAAPTTAEKKQSTMKDGIKAKAEAAKKKTEAAPAQDQKAEAPKAASRPAPAPTVKAEEPAQDDAPPPDVKLGTAEKETPPEDDDSWMHQK